MSEQPPTERSPEDPTRATPRDILRDYLDEHDYRIFSALNEDGRMSDTELAERVGLSRTAVRRRREKLVDSGILEVLAVIVLQEADLAYADVQVYLDHGASADDRNRLIERLIDADFVYSLDSCMGEYDLFVRAWHGSLSDIKTYVWELLEDEPAVGDYELTPVIKTWKAWDRELDRPAASE